MEKTLKLCKEITINPTAERHCGDCYKWHLADKMIARNLRIEDAPEGEDRFAYCDIFNKAIIVNQWGEFCRLPECKAAEVDKKEEAEVIKAYYFHAHDMERKYSDICSQAKSAMRFSDLMDNVSKMMLWRGRAQAFKRSLNILLGNKEHDRWEDE